MLETTRDKVNRLFTPQTRQKLDAEGLMVIDKEDFQVVMDTYNQLKADNRVLHAQVKQLEAKQRPAPVPKFPNPGYRMTESRGGVDVGQA